MLFQNDVLAKAAGVLGHLPIKRKVLEALVSFLLEGGKILILLRFFLPPRNQFLPDRLRTSDDCLGPKVVTGCGHGALQLPSERQATLNCLERFPLASPNFQEVPQLTLVLSRIIDFSTTPTLCFGLLSRPASRKKALVMDTAVDGLLGLIYAGAHPWAGSFYLHYWNTLGNTQRKNEVPSFLYNLI